VCLVDVEVAASGAGCVAVVRHKEGQIRLAQFCTEIQMLQKSRFADVHCVRHVLALHQKGTQVGIVNYHLVLR
jgi:hypothetical protein